MSKEKILVRDETNLGHSYYIDDDDVTYGDGYYYDSSTGKIVDNWNDGNSSTTSYYDNYYPSTYYPSTYYDYRYRNYREDKLTLDGSTVVVGSKYDDDVWLDDDYPDSKALDASRNDKNLKFGGNDRNNTIISGGGRTTLYGNGGDSNTLVGGDGRNYFFFNGKSNDIAVDFSVGERENSDVIVISGFIYSSIHRDNGNISFYAPNGNRMQLRTGNVSEEVPIFLYWDKSDIYKYQIALDSSSSMNYRDDIQTFYFNRPAQIVVNGENHNVILDGSRGQNFANVNTINAASSYGYNTLIGNAGANLIIGGNGISTLWGNEDLSPDTLIGGNGIETFFVGKNDGNDVVVSDDLRDLICLRDTSYSDITYVDIDADQIVAGFNTGSQMTVRTFANITPKFQLADGSRYNYYRDSGQWAPA